MSPGAVLAGRYRLGDLLEEADGARFWRATDLVLMRDVALHVLSADDARTPAMLEAARQCALVPGHHALRVLDAVVEDGVAYVVNEWGDGVSLDRMLSEGPLPPRQAAWMVREVADALVVAHANHVFHGRLVPENVLLGEGGTVKVLGFALDAALHGLQAPADPERLDLVDLGSILYAALVGRWPGSADSAVGRAPLDHGRVMRPRQVRAGIPPVLDRICDDVVNAPADQPVLSAVEVRALLTDFLGEATEASALSGQPAPYDPDATQFGLPVIDDDLPPQTTTTAPPVPAYVPAYVPDPVTSSGPLFPRPTLAAAPASWGAVEEPTDNEPRDNPWLKLAGLLALVLVLAVGVVFAFNLGRDDSGDGNTPSTDPTKSSSGPRATGDAVTVSEVNDFDPFAVGGPKTENPDEVPAATDGNPSTAWHTSTYKDGPDLTVYKPGVGLLVDLGSVQTVGEVSLTLQGTPNSVQLLTAASGAAKPTGITGLTQSASVSDGGTSVTLRPTQAVRTQYLVIWLTALPQVRGGFRGAVAEIVVRS